MLDYMKYGNGIKREILEHKKKRENKQKRNWTKIQLKQKYK